MDTTVSRAIFALIGLAITGYMLGRAATSAVDESVEKIWSAELAEREQAAADQQQNQELAA